MIETITLQLGERSYDVNVGAGLLDRCGEMLAPIARGPIPIVTDTHVADLHLDRVVASLRGAHLEPYPIVLAAGEDSKSFAGLENLTSALIGTGVDRGGLIVALGGGVVGDLTGFAAAILKRGIAFAQLPTTLLAQVDSSVGGKTAINTPEGKNLVGVFHQPRMVLADTDTLSTLPRREMLGGYAEVAKYAALGDARFFDWLESNGRKALDGDGPAVVYAVATSCRMKAEIVSRDERETGERALLNLGHTFGHALEAATGYSGRLLHGEGVAIGMALAFRLSVKLGLCGGQESERFIGHLASVGLPVSISEVPGPRPSAETLLGHMLHDKKAKKGRINFVLLRGIGRAFVTDDVPAELVVELLG